MASRINVVITDENGKETPSSMYVVDAREAMRNPEVKIRIPDAGEAALVTRKAPPRPSSEELEAQSRSADGDVDAPAPKLPVTGDVDETRRVRGGDAKR